MMFVFTVCGADGNTLMGAPADGEARPMATPNARTLVFAAVNRKVFMINLHGQGSASHAR
jgi:hypothetical protein